MMLRFLPLLSVLAAAAMAHAAEPPSHRDSVAVVIGNKSYQGRIPEVAYAHRDADAMKAYLTQVLGYREGNIIDLRDATQAELMSAFGNRDSHEGKVWRFVRPGISHVTVFYSGHGVPGLKDKRGYLLPVDADPDTPEINGYPVDVLYRNLSKLEAASVTVYLDACFSGESDQGMLIRSASPVFVQAQAPAVSEGLTVLTAASAEQVASWDEENRHGLFTWHLLQALQGEADKAPFGDGDGAVTVAETQAYLDGEMTYVARRRFGRIQNASVQGSGDALLGVVPDDPVVAPTEVAALTPAFQVQEMDKIMIVAEVRVNTRSGPGTTYEKVETLTRGVEVEVTGKVEGKDWYRIALAGGRTAFIYGPLLRDSLDSPAEPAVGVLPATPTTDGGFKDCDVCLEMVVVPAGSFQMGSPSYEQDRADKEGPVRQVTIPWDFAVGRYEVTKGEYAAFVTATGYAGGSSCQTYEDKTWSTRQGRSWRDPGFPQGDDEPVVCVSWGDARAYIEWLSRLAGKRYRLLGEAEWEYAARAGTTGARYWGDDSAAACDYANVHDYSSRSGVGLGDDNHACDDGAAYTAVVGGYDPNDFGLFDMLGNVHEWTEDCANESYEGAPPAGGAWTAGDCSERIMRGGSWVSDPSYVRSARRGDWDVGDRDVFLGFRVARAAN